MVGGLSLSLSPAISKSQLQPKCVMTPQLVIIRVQLMGLNEEVFAGGNLLTDHPSIFLKEPLRMLAFPQKPKEQLNSFLFCPCVLIPVSVIRYRREKRRRGLM